MAGLLDFMNTDDAKLGIALLGAGGYSSTPMSFGQRLGGAMQGFNADRTATEDRLLKKRFTQSQIDENTSQAEARKALTAQKQAQLAQDAQFLGLNQQPSGGLLGEAPAAPAASQFGNTKPAIPEGAAGTPQAVQAFAQGTPATFGGAALTAQQISQKYNIPLEAIINDYRNNSGKKIAEFIMSKGTPDMQVSNGYAYDKNKLQSGYLPSLTTSTSGQTSMTQIGPDGQPVVSAPRGAVETFGAYQGQAANFKPIKIYNPATGREEYTSEGAVVGQPPVNTSRPVPMAGRPGNVTSAGYTGGDRNSANAESIRIMQEELKNPNIPAADRAGIQREIGRMQMQSGQPQSGNMPAGPSAAETADAEAAKVRKVDTAKADVVRDTTKIADVKTANKFLGIVDQVEKVFKDGPTNSGIGSAYDATAAVFGSTPKGAEAAQRLKGLGGWLVANVPRMEGPQSNFDVANYQVMAGDVANDKLPLARRMAALDSIKTMMKGVPGVTIGGASGEGDGPAKPSKVLDSLPTANGSNKGQRIRDTTTGKVLVSNGMQWKEE